MNRIIKLYFLNILDHISFFLNKKTCLHFAQKLSLSWVSKEHDLQIWMIGSNNDQDGSLKIDTALSFKPEIRLYSLHAK